MMDASMKSEDWRVTSNRNVERAETTECGEDNGAPIHGTLTLLSKDLKVETRGVRQEMGRDRAREIPWLFGLFHSVL
jgi:hypothetical protein